MLYLTLLSTFYRSKVKTYIMIDYNYIFEISRWNCLQKFIRKIIKTNLFQHKSTYYLFSLSIVIIVRSLAKFGFVTPLYLIQPFIMVNIIHLNGGQVVSFCNYFGFRPTRSSQNEIDGEHKYKKSRSKTY